ncbi:MAG: DUF2779 domain-containing protein [Steroidobacteraceae bacterium]
MKSHTLSKSRFKLAIECPTKVHYSLDKRYADERLDDEFLEALADGGHQVGALAKLMLRAQDPGAIEITSRDQDEQVRETAELLTRHGVTIFEGTIRFENLLIRADIVVKRGKQVELIEVKAKSWDPHEDSLIGTTTRSNPLSPDWEPYVYDVAFQHYVFAKAHPELTINPYLLLVDKSRRNTVPGLGSKFPILGSGRDTAVAVAPDFDVAALGEPLLIQVDAAEAVHRAQTLVRERKGRPPLEFGPLIQQLARAIEGGERLDPLPSTACKQCEFYCDPAERSDDSRSGWAECMETYFRKEASKPRATSIFGFYNQADIYGHIAARRLWMQELGQADLGVKPKAGQISRTERHELQWQEIALGDSEPFLRAADLKRVIENWRYPLHFIDFETVAPVLPFHVGHRPYQQILFQFSHHRMERDGSVRHATECLIVDGEDSPSIAVVRQLRDAIGQDEGTVLHWYPHERTILGSIHEEIRDKSPADADVLVAFLESLGLSKDSGLRLFDLGRLVEQSVFLAGTGGSSSMKKFLPAVIRQSGVVRQRYSQPVYGSPTMPSLNFENQTWVVEHDGAALDPYKLLSPLFAEHDVNDALARLEETEGTVVADGAAAMIAYASLQNPEFPSTKCKELMQQLKRYCELDTLAMVIVHEAVADWIGKDEVFA